jgi:hypothetical protein
MKNYIPIWLASKSCMKSYGEFWITLYGCYWRLMKSGSFSGLQKNRTTNRTRMGVYPRQLPPIISGLINLGTTESAVRALRGRLHVRVRFCVQITMRFRARFAYKGVMVSIIIWTLITTDCQHISGKIS